MRIVQHAMSRVRDNVKDSVWDIVCRTVMHCCTRGIAYRVWSGTGIDNVTSVRDLTQICGQNSIEDIFRE